jgi:hypothetical protein
MEEKEYQNQIRVLETKIQKLEDTKGKKNIWDIISIITSFLIPLSIFFAGYFLSKSDQEAKIANSQKELQIAEIKSKVDQATLVSVFLEALIDTNVFKRQLAIKSILLALPEKGEEIVRMISDKDPNENVKNYAKESLNENSNNKIRNDLIQKIFDKDKQTRMLSTNQLIQNCINDEMLVTELINYANNRLDDAPENMSGIINTIVVLNKVNHTILKNNHIIVSNFIDKIENLEGRTETKKNIQILKLQIK